MECVAKTTMRKEHGEYHVRAYSQFGKRMPDSDYFTDDKGDANDTAKAMVETYRGFLVNRLNTARERFESAFNSARGVRFTDGYGFNIDVLMYARDVAHFARLLLENDTDALLRVDALSNDSLVAMYHDANTKHVRNIIADVLRTRIARKVILPDEGDNYYSGAPDYRCQHCGIPGGH